MPKAQFAFSYKWTFIWRGVYWHMCLHFDGATPTEWKEQGRAPIFLKTSQVYSFFFFVSILYHNLQLKLSFPHLYKMAMIQTKTDWKSRTPHLTHCKSDSEIWSFCSTKRKSLLKSEDHNVQFIHDEDAICVINKHKSSSVTPSYCSREPIDHNHGVSKKELGISGKL